MTHSIGSKTYYLPASLQNIGKDSFDPESKLVVHKGSYAEQWAKQTYYDYEVIP